MTRENLFEAAKRWSKALRDSCSGPLLVAREFVAIAERWDTFPSSETKNMDASQWGHAHLGGQYIKWFEIRAAVANRIMARGGDAITSWDHITAVWCARFETDHEFKKMCDLLTAERKTTGKIPSKPTAMRLARDAGLIAKRQPRVPHVADCARCQKLEKFILANGLKVPK